MAGALVPAVRRIGPMASLEELRQAVDDLQEFVQTREPLESGDPLDKYLTLRAAVESGLVIYRGPGGGGSGGGVGIPPVRPPEDWDDLTPPDPITTLTVDSIPTGFFIQFDPPTYRQGGGNAYTIIYRANYSGAGPLPTFGDSEECGRCTARNPIKVLAAEPGTISHFWAQPVSHAEDFQNVTPQTAPTGGTNGVSETAGQLNDDHIAELSAGKLTAGAIAVGEYIESAGYDPGVDGWRINGTGDAEFNDLVLRGTIYASGGLIGGALIGTTYVQSTNYNGTGTGWKLDNANDKVLAGQITISNTGATRGFNTEASGTTTVLKVGSATEVLAKGNASVGGALSASSVVTTDNIAPGAVTIPQSDAFATITTGSGDTTYSTSIDFSEAGVLIVFVSFALADSGGGSSQNVTFRLSVDATQVYEELQNVGTVVCFTWSGALAAGTHDLDLDFEPSGGTLDTGNEIRSIRVTCLGTMR